MKFRKKPVVIEATQWFKNGDHPLDYASPQDGFQNGRLVSIPGEHRKAHNWEGEVVRYHRTPEGKLTCDHCDKSMNDHGWIDTLEGGHIVCPGDWIITGVKGEHYPCKPDIFEMTYERVEDTEKAMQEVQRLGEEIQPDIAYSVDHDAYYYIDTGEWIDPRCGDTGCRFCKCRPKNMKAERVDKTEKDRHEKFCDNHCVWTDHHPDCPLKEKNT